MAPTFAMRIRLLHGASQCIAVDRLEMTDEGNLRVAFSDNKQCLPDNPRLLSRHFHRRGTAP